MTRGFESTSRPITPFGLGVGEGKSGCLPGDIPRHIDVDITELDLHGVLRVSDLPHADKIKYLTSEDAAVVHVVAIREEATEVAAEVEGGSAGAAAPARRFSCASGSGFSPHAS